MNPPKTVDNAAPCANLSMFVHLVTSNQLADVPAP